MIIAVDNSFISGICSDMKPTQYFLFLATGWGMTLNPLAAQKPPAPLSPLQKISQSFSDDKLGRTTMPKGAKLMQSEFNNSECSAQKLADCYVRDVNGVELYFSPYDGLNSKEITIGPSYSGKLRALGIGTARSKKDVLAAAARFVPGLSFACASAYKPEDPRKNYVSCGSNIPNKMGEKAQPKALDPATVEFLFDADDRVQTMKVIRSNFID